MICRFKVLSATFVLAAVAGCNRGAPPDTSELDPKVENQSVIIPAKSRARETLATSEIAAAEPRRSRLNGRIVWNDDITVRIYPPVAGRVERVNVQPSARVESGAALAMISSSDFAQIRSDAKKAAADFALADKTRERIRFLVEHGAAARKDLEAAEADYERAKSELERAKATVEMRGGSSDTDPGLFLLRTPIAGIVVEKNISPGQEVRPDQMLANAPQFFAPLFVISDPTDLWVLIDVSEQDVTNLSIGATVTIHAPVLGDRMFPAKVEAISDALDPSTRMLRVRARVQNPDRLLKAEMFVSVEIETPTARNVEAPAKAVLMNNGNHFVFVEEQPGRFSRREVQVAGEQGDKLLISSGLAPGDRVVTEGTQLLERIRAEAAAN